jgi:hypothetical protein
MISKSLESEDWYRQAINQWLDQQGIEIDTIVRQESGIIAMHSSLPIDPTYCAHWRSERCG